MSKDTFKSFARKHPELAESVLRGNTSWQQLYELYEIYGEENTIWKNYFSPSVGDSIASSTTIFKDFFNNFKNLDVDSIQKGIQNIQKTIDMLQDMGKKEEKKPIFGKLED